MDINELERKQSAFYHDLRQFADRYPFVVWALLVYHLCMVLAIEMLK